MKLVKRIDLDYSPASIWTIFCIIFVVMTIMGVIVDWKAFLALFITILMLISNLTTYRKKITLFFTDDGRLITVKRHLLKKEIKPTSIQLSDIVRIWEYTYSINFIPSSSDYKGVDKNGKRYTILSINGNGNLSNKDKQRFLSFIKECKPDLKFGYIKGL